MTEVLIQGRLGDVVGRTHTLHCSTLKEIFTAIECNTGKLRKYLLRNKKRKFAVFINDKSVNSDFADNYNVKHSKVTILPILMGAVGMTIALAATGATMATATASTFIVAGIINAAISFGISMLISKLLAPDDPKTVSTTSFIFGSPENVSSQGEPVPVGYGRLIVAGKVISVSSFNVDKNIFEDQSFYNTLSQGNIDLSIENTRLEDQGSSASTPL